MVLVAQASPAGLRPALCRLLTELGEVQVRLRAPELAALAPGSVALLRVVPEDILWLNYNRPLVSERRLKLVLWAEGEVASAMRAQAPDFFDWISHVLPCPRLTPGFALAGVKALGPDATARWDGDGLVGALRSAGQESMVVFEDASRHYRSLQRAARAASAGVCWTAVDRARRLHRARWAMAEGRVNGPSLLLDAALPTPGWVSLHARCQDWGEAAAALAEAGVPEPAREAALLGLEPEAITLRAAMSRLAAPPPPPPSLDPLADEGARLAEHAASLPGLPLTVPASLLKRAGLPLAEIAPTTALERRVRALADALRVAEEASAEPWLKASREALDLGHPDAALTWAQRAARLADTPERIALAEQALGLARLALGDVSTQPDPSEQISRPLALPDLSAAERARTQLHVAFVALTRGDLERAGAMFDELLLTLDAVEEHQGLRGAALVGSGRIALARGALPAARSFAEGALTTIAEARQADSAAAGLLAEVLLDEGRAQDAFEAADAHLGAVSAALGEEHPAALRALRLRAEARLAAGDATGALLDAQRAVRLGDEVQGVDHPDLARARVALGRAFAMCGRQDDAIRTIEMAISSAERALPADHLELSRAREALAAALQREGTLLVPAPIVLAAPPTAEAAPRRALDMDDSLNSAEESRGAASSVSDEEEDDQTQSERSAQPSAARLTLSAPAAPPPPAGGASPMSKSLGSSASLNVDAVSYTRKALTAQMRAAYAQRDALAAQGAEVVEAEQEIVSLRKSLRRGPVLQAGELLGQGRYELLERIGQGGFAAVWRALDRETNKVVALKVLHPHWADQPSRRDRFVRGAQVMRTLQHPHLLRVLSDAQEEDGFWFFAMEHLPGGDLAQALAAGRLGATRAIEAVLEVGEALAVAHQAGIIHRDVKPANILFDASGRACLSDFDLVESLNRSATLSLGGMGTFLYAAPELLDADPHPSPRADVYSLGLVALTCYRGGQDPPAPSLGVMRVLNDTSAPVAVKALLRRALSTDPDQRPADAGAFVEALRDALHDHPDQGGAEELYTLPQNSAPSASRESSARPNARVVTWRVALVAFTTLGVMTGWGIGRVMTDPIQLVSDVPTAPTEAPPEGVVPEGPGVVKAPSLTQTFNAPSMALTAPILFTPLNSGDETLLMSVTEVTNTQWDALRDDNPSLKPSSHLPVTGVSAQAAMEFANALSKAEGLTPAYVLDEAGGVTLDPTSNGYRLPTLSEWEDARAQSAPERLDTKGPTRAARADTPPEHLVGLGSNASEWVWTDEGPALAGRSWLNPDGALRRPKATPRDAGVRLVRPSPSAAPIKTPTPMGPEP